jgi:hypothetical protein
MRIISYKWQYNLFLFPMLEVRKSPGLLSIECTFWNRSFGVMWGPDDAPTDVISGSKDIYRRYK